MSSATPGPAPASALAVVALVLALAGLSGGCTTGLAAGADGSGLIGPATPRYVVLGTGAKGETRAFARIILPPGRSCPVVVAAETWMPEGGIPMTLRRVEEGYDFPPLCEAAVPFDASLAIRFASGVELSLPTVRRDPRDILAMGDTGCKDCAVGEPATEFAALAAAAADPVEPWDLLLHLGDYNYRGTPSKVTFSDGSQDWAYDAGDGTEESESCLQSTGSAFVSQNAPGNTPRDSWSAWNLDFFTPAGELLWAAPWVFVRGNHELCSRAGPGWFYFLDASSELAAGGGAQRRCPPADPPSDRQIDNVVLTPPAFLDLGDLRLVVMDSANACDAFALPDMADFTEAYTQQMTTVAASMVGSSTPSFFLSHRPVWGLGPYEAGTSSACASGSAYACINRTLQQAATEAFFGGVWPSEVVLLLSGHMHNFQSLTFPGDADVPPQLVVGNGGVALADADPVGTFSVPVERLGMARTVAGTSLGPQALAGTTIVDAFGFLELQYRPDGSWGGVVWNRPVPVALAKCSSHSVAATGNVCELLVTP